MIRTLILFSLLLFNFSTESIAQKDSCGIQISLLTCGAGEELYSTFGHSALRVKDSATNDDIVYNFGTFNFDEPDFYTKFIRGKLLYYLSTEDFLPFIQAYQRDKRSIVEQVLNLTCTEKIKMLQLLQQNLLAENRFYKYDFLFDNCTTRLRDLLEKSSDSTVYYSHIVKPATTFRDLLYVSLNYYDKQWSKLGIDLLLGSKTDAIMAQKEVMYLPEYLMRSFDSERIGTKPVVQRKNVLYDPAISTQNNFLTTPFFFFILLLVIIIIMSLSKNKIIQKMINGFDGLIFFMTGLAGLIFLFMWLCTDHQMYSKNYNLIWALPTHAIAAFFIHRNNFLVKKYLLFTIAINIILLAAWFFLPQHLNIALLPFILLLTFRSAVIWKVNS